MRVGVLGCGSIGQRHIRNLRTLGVDEIVAFDPDTARREEARAAGARPLPQEDALLALHPDAVFVCTPPVLHLEGALAALRAGADVFIEKPISDTLDGVAEMLAVAATAGRIVGVGYNLRFDPGLIAAKALIDGGEIGRALSIRAEFGQDLRDWRPSREYREGYNAKRALGGRLLLDQSHELDYVRWLFGEAESVSAVTAKVTALEIEAEDIALVQLRLRSGALAEVHLDCVRRDYVRRCTVVGSDGTLVWDLADGVSVRPAREPRWRVIRAGADRNEMYLAEVREFLDCVRARRDPPVSGEDGLRTLELVAAAERAAAERREVSVPVSRG